MSEIGEVKVDLSERKRVGPEDESREEQFEEGFRDGPGGKGGPDPIDERSPGGRGSAPLKDPTKP